MWVVDGMVRAMEEAAGLPGGHYKFLPQIETPGALLQLTEIAAHPPNVAILYGGADMAVEAGLADLQTVEESRTYRSLVVAAAHAHGLVPIDTPSTRIHDHAGFVRQCEEARRLGFTAACTLAPEQVRIAHSIYAHPCLLYTSPSPRDS